MKRKLIKVFALLLVLSVLGITVYAADSNAPGIKVREDQINVVLYEEDVDVDVTLDLGVCYGIEGTWSVTTDKASSIKLTGLKAEFTPLPEYGEALDVTTGDVAWADCRGDESTHWSHPIDYLTATYTIPADTPDGTYKVTFTCIVFFEHDTEDGFVMQEGEWTYAANIVVSQHKCDDSLTDSDHKCDDSKCGKDGVTTHAYTLNTAQGTGGYQWSADGKSCVAYGICSCGETSVAASISSAVKAEATCSAMGTTTYTATFSEAWASTQTKDVQDIAIDADAHSYPEQPSGYTDNGDGTHTAYYSCANNAEHKRYDDAAAHNYDQTGDKCLCGAVKPADPVTGMLGDVNGDELINSADLTALARHVGGIEVITDSTLLANADVNGDGSVNSADLTKHARYVGGIITDWSQE